MSSGLDAPEASPPAASHHVSIYNVNSRLDGIRWEMDAETSKDFLCDFKEKQKDREEF